MCIICVSNKGIAQPTTDQLRMMFQNNPDGAGYMYARDGKVTIHKGFMTVDDLLHALKIEAFGPSDVVVYHFRISTQGGVNPGLTHPYPFSKRLTDCTELDLECSCGLAHNGIIRLTSDKNDKRYNDTVRFITKYLTRLVRREKDWNDPDIIKLIDSITWSKWAVLSKKGDVTTIGNFVKHKGLLFSNDTYMERIIYPPYDWTKYHGSGMGSEAGYGAGCGQFGSDAYKEERGYPVGKQVIPAAKKPYVYEDRRAGFVIYDDDDEKYWPR